jgi:hypothetical protein
MIGQQRERNMFTSAEAAEIRRLLDELNDTRRAAQRMSLARLRHMQLGIAAKPDTPLVAPSRRRQLAYS